MITTIDLPTEGVSEQVAMKMASCLVAPLVMTFSGEIGAGKTTLIRAMLRHLGVKSAIKSPTFSLVESYQINHLQIHHFDLYRVHEESELDFIGFRDYFSKDAVCCIEWPERVASRLSNVDIRISLGIKGAGREMQLCALTPAGASMLSCLTGE
jgi:tRNA threonylcarbamoyladenosine biosynthesis protein TsaE